MKAKILVTSVLPQGPIEQLEKTCQVMVHDESKALSKEELMEKVADVDGIICLLSDTIDQEVLDAAKKAKVIANYAVGYNNIDVAYATKKGIAVTNTPGVLTDATADLAWVLLFAVARRVVEGDRFTREGRFEGWQPMLFLGQDVSHTTLGIIGAGRIGSNFAKKAKAFDMKILYHNRRPNKAFEEETGALYVDKETLLRESDYVSLHVPLTNETRHMLGEREFKMMKPNAILINTARGPVVDEKALVKALKEGWIWGAGLDVYEEEPAVEPELLKLDNVVLLPHVGSATTSTRTKMAQMVVDNVLEALKGNVPPNCINPEIYR